MTKRTAINKNSGQVMNALISAGYYDVTIRPYDDKTVIDVSMYPTIRFNKLEIYEDIVRCFEGGRFSFEMPVCSKKQILSDLKN